MTITYPAGPVTTHAADTSTHGIADTGQIAGEGHIFIHPMAYQSIGQGTWALNADANHMFAFTWRNITHADADEISYNVFLEKGTYTIAILGEKSIDLGIMDIDIDAGNVGTIDWYNGAQVRNSWNTVTSVAVATAGVKSLTVRVDGKNASSSDHWLVFTMIVLWRTA